MERASLLNLIKKVANYATFFFPTKPFVSNAVSKILINNKIINKYQYLISKISGLHHSAHTAHAAHIRHCRLVFWNVSNHTFGCQH